MTKTPTRDDVQAAVDKLVQRQRIRLYRDGTDHAEWQTLPSLWEQLTTSTSWKGSGTGGGTFGSRPVIATGVVALRDEIERFAVRGADEVAVNHRDTPSGRLQLADLAADEADGQVELRKAELAMVTAHPTDDMTDDEKTEYAAELVDCIAQVDAAIQHVAALADEADAKRRTLVPDSLRLIAASITDTVDIAWWRETIHGWVTQIRANLALDPTRPQYARNTPCPNCQATTTSAQRDGEAVRTPAMAITWGGPTDDAHHSDDQWHVRAVECKACGATWWRGPDLDRLVAQIMANSPAHQPMERTA